VAPSPGSPEPEPASNQNLVKPTVRPRRPTDFNSYLSALDEADWDLTSVSLPSLGLDDDQLTTLIHKFAATTYGPTLTSLNLDGNGLSAQASLHIAQFLQNQPCRLLSLSLNWNMIGGEGAHHLADALASPDCPLLTLNLAGNELRASGATALATALLNNSRLAHLNLKENGIGDGEDDNPAALALAQALTHCPSLTFLDLTGNGLGRGISPIAAALGQNTSLTCLVLDDNELYDRGATAVGEALSTNSTLVALRLRNNFIGEGGTVGEGVRGLLSCRHLSALDLCLNNLSLQEEMALQDLHLARPALKLLWKEPGMQTLWEPSDVKTIISHYGSQKVLERLSVGDDLEPLITTNILLPSLTLNDIEAANRLVHFVFQIMQQQDRRDRMLTHAFDLLMNFIKPSDAEADAPLESLPPMVFALCSQFNVLYDFLSDTNMESVGLARIKLLELLILLAALNYEAIYKLFIEYKLTTLCLDLMFLYERNNFLHNTVNVFIKQLLQSSWDPLTEEIIESSGLLQRLVTTVEHECSKPVALRKGYIGSLVDLALSLPTITENELLQSKLQAPFWTSFVSGCLNDEEASQSWSFPKPVKEDESTTVPRKLEAGKFAT
jgi:hypothetical protein